MIVLPPGPLLFTPGESSVTAVSVRPTGRSSISSCLKFALTCVDSTAAVNGVSAVTVIASDTAAARSWMSSGCVRVAVSSIRRVTVCMPSSSNVIV
jgi:hypothetical protein